MSPLCKTSRTILLTAALAAGVVAASLAVAAAPATTAPAFAPVQPAAATMPSLVDDPALARIKVDVAWLAGPDGRTIGTPGHDRVISEFRGRLEGIAKRYPGKVRVWTHEFSVVAPVVEEAYVVLDGQATRTDGGSTDSPPQKNRIYPLWPANVRLNSTPAEGITGKLVYVGQATPGELPSPLGENNLRSQIAVMETSGAANWRYLADAGARAILLLGSRDENQLQLQAHLSLVPLNLPRFYVPEGPLAKRLRDAKGGKGETALLQSRCQWKEVPATNFYVLVQPSRPSNHAQLGALTIAVATDGMSVVPEQAPAADGAVNVAVAMEMLRTLSEPAAPGAKGSDRPVLFAFADACGINYLGIRQMLLALESDADGTRTVRERDRTYLEAYKADADLAARLDGKTTEELIRALDSSEYRRFNRYVRDEVSAKVIEIDERMGQLRLKQPYSEDAAGADANSPGAAELARLQAQREFLWTAQRVLLGRIPDDQPRSRKSLELAASLWRNVRARIDGQYKETRQRVDGWAMRDTLQREIIEGIASSGAAKDSSVHPIGMVLGLDLSDAGVAAGPALYCDHYKVNQMPSAGAFLQWLRQVAPQGWAGKSAIWPGELSKTVDLGVLMGLDSPGSYVVGHVGALSSPGMSFGIASCTWSTLNAQRLRPDTPQDTPDRLNWQQLAPQVEVTLRLVQALAGASIRDGNGRAVEMPPLDMGARSVGRWTNIDGAIVDQAPGEPVPHLPMPGCLASLINGASRAGCGVPYDAGWTSGVRREEFHFAGSDGRVFFDAMPGNVGNILGMNFMTSFYLQAYQLDADGSIARATDLKKAGKGVTLNTSVGQRQGIAVRAVLFPCAQVDAAYVFDPRYMLPLPLATVLDVRRGSEPQRLNLTLSGGSMCAFLEPGLQWEMIYRAGVTQNRMVLLNVSEKTGQTSDDVRQSVKGFDLSQQPTHIWRQGAVDFWRLDEMRIADYARAGIRSQAIEELHRGTNKYLETSGGEAASGSGVPPMSPPAVSAGESGTVSSAHAQPPSALQCWRSASGAISNELRAYQAVRDMANDVIRGAIFLLLGLIPLAVALERLIIASPSIYKQIGWSCLIFAVMAGALWSFHPAFRISNQPLMIVMAFAIIFMSSLVIVVVYSKFRTGLAELRSGRAETSAARTSRLGLITTALKLGIANMRRRKLRTALTAATIVLVTFALLCFTSTSSYEAQRQSSLDVRAPFTGVLVHQPAGRPLPDATLEYLKNLAAAEAESSGVKPAQILPRYWWAQPLNPQWQMHVRNPRSGQQISLSAGLGLSGHEGLVSTKLAALMPNWKRFAELAAERGMGVSPMRPEGILPSLEHRGCYLAASAAEELGVRAGQTVLVAGDELEVVGVYDSSRVDRELVDMDGQSLLPSDYSAMSEQQRQEQAAVDVNQVASELESQASSGAGASRELRRLSSAVVAILPADMMGGAFEHRRDCTLRSVAVATSNGTTAEQWSLDLANRLAYPMYYGRAGDQVRVVAGTPLLPKAPKSLWIPLIIAAGIIFNTMLSSIADRKREIHIYTSLGLAPLHVGVLFLAEAVTYGLMGSIFGYVAGQGVATGLAKLGLMGSITLNYSGTQVIATMLMVQAVVVLSSLVPAYLAGKVAAPSEEMSWRVPKPQGDVIRDRLPFTVTPQTANGMAAFVLEYFDAHREGSIGQFSADEVRLTLDRETSLLGLAATVWLAPYDMGVRQDVLLILRPTDVPDVCSIDVELTRGSGQTSSWTKLNKVFLGDLRRQLLGWRKLKVERLLEYISQAQKHVRELENDREAAAPKSAGAES